MTELETRSLEHGMPTSMSKLYDVVVSTSVGSLPDVREVTFYDIKMVPVLEVWNANLHLWMGMEGPAVVLSIKAGMATQRKSQNGRRTRSSGVQCVYSTGTQTHSSVLHLVLLCSRPEARNRWDDHREGPI